MIWHPKPGQVVEIRYRKSAREGMIIRSKIGVYYKLHEIRGVIETAGTGPGPVNALVKLQFFSGNVFIVVPRGNLFNAGEQGCGCQKNLTKNINAGLIMDAGVFFVRFFVFFPLYPRIFS